MFANDDEPATYTEAMNGANAHELQAAMNSEMLSLSENDTWTLVTREANMHVIDNKWVYKLKTDSDGNVKYKARLISKGYSQTAGID